MTSLKVLRWLSILLVVAAAATVILALVTNARTSTAIQEPRLPEVTQREFTDLEQASAFAGFPIAAPRMNGWTAKHQIVSKHNRPDGELIIAEVLFTGSELEHALRLSIMNEEGEPWVARGNPETIYLGDVQATMDRGPDDNPAVRVVSWNKDGRFYNGLTLVSDKFSERDFLAVLESIAAD